MQDWLYGYMEKQPRQLFKLLSRLFIKLSMLSEKLTGSAQLEGAHGVEFITIR